MWQTPKAVVTSPGLKSQGLQLCDCQADICVIHCTAMPGAMKYRFVHLAATCLRASAESFAMPAASPCSACRAARSASSAAAAASCSLAAAASLACLHHTPGVFNRHTDFTSPWLTEMRMSYGETNGFLDDLKEEIYGGDRADTSSRGMPHGGCLPAQSHLCCPLWRLQGQPVQDHMYHMQRRPQSSPEPN